MSENDKLNTLWKRINLIHKKIEETKENLQDVKKYHQRIEKQYEEDLTLLYQQSFDLYSEILLTSLVTNNRQTPSAYDTKTDYNSGTHTSWTEFKKLRTPTNTFDENIKNKTYRSYRPDTSKWYEEEDHDFYEGN